LVSPGSSLLDRSMTPRAGTVMRSLPSLMPRRSISCRRSGASSIGSEARRRRRPEPRRSRGARPADSEGAQRLRNQRPVVRKDFTLRHRDGAPEAHHARAAAQHAVARECDVRDVEVVRRDAVPGIETASDRDCEPAVEEGGDDAAVHRAERAEQRLRDVHAQHRLGFVGAFDGEAEELPEPRQSAHGLSWRAKRPAYTALPSQRWRTIWHTRTPGWIVSGCFATFDISSTWRLSTPGATKPAVTWIMRPRR